MPPTSQRGREVRKSAPGVNNPVVRIFKWSEGFPEEVVTELRSKEKVDL